MRLLMSPRAGAAALQTDSGVQAFLLRRHELEVVHPCFVERALACCVDLVAESLEQQPTRDELRDRLRLAQLEARALDLALMVLDSSIEESTRFAAAVELTADLESTRSHLENLLLSRPLPSTVCRDQVFPILRHKQFAKLWDVFGTMFTLQPKIQVCWQAWQSISPNLFSDEGSRTSIRNTLIRRGVFSAIACGESSPEALDESIVRSMEVFCASNRAWQSIARAWGEQLELCSIESDEWTDSLRGAGEIGGAARSIMIVEDDACLAHVLDHWARSGGLSTETFSSVRAATAFGDESTALPDLVLVDFHLPDGNGLTLLRRLRTKSSTAHFFLMSGLLTDQVRLAAERLGVTACLAKPFNLLELGRTLSRREDRFAANR